MGHLRLGLDVGGINATLTYTRAQTFYSLMCALAPHLPNNEGSLRPLTMAALLGSILNCRFPAPINLRLRSGWHLNPTPEEDEFSLEQVQEFIDLRRRGASEAELDAAIERFRAENEAKAVQKEETREPVAAD